MSQGSRTHRLQGAQRAGKAAQSVDGFLGQFERPKAKDPRKYRIRHGAEFFKKWEGTSWETVKRFATWTKEPNDAAVMTLDDWDKSAYMDLVTGFAGVRLEEVK